MSKFSLLSIEELIEKLNFINNDLFQNGVK